MASDEQWSGLLLVVILVAIFSIVSVSGMAVYFFCKCKKDKRKRTQIRPTIRGGFEEEEEEGVLFQRGRQNNDLNWATVENADSTDIPIMGRNYMAPRRGNVDTAFQEQRVHVDEKGIYDTTNFKSHRRQKIASRQNKTPSTSDSTSRPNTGHTGRENNHIKIDKRENSLKSLESILTGTEIEHVDITRSTKRVLKEKMKRSKEKSNIGLIHNDDDLNVQNHTNIEESLVSASALRSIHMTGNRALPRPDIEITQMENSDDFETNLATENDNNISKSPRRIYVESRATFRNPIEKIHSEKELMKSDIGGQQKTRNTYVDNSGNVRPTKRKHVESSGKQSTPRRKNTEERKTIKTFREVKTDDEDFLKIINAVREYNDPGGLKQENTGTVCHDETGGLFIKPQRIKVRDSSSRESCTSITSSHDIKNNRVSKRDEENTRASRTINTPIGSTPLIFTASSKMAWMFDR